MMMRRIFILALYIIALILLIYIQAEFPNLNRKYGIPARYFDAVLLYSTGLLILAIVKRLVLGVYARRNNVDHDRTNNNFTLGVRRISSVIGAIILFISLLGAFNVDVQALFTALSIVAAALAIVTREYVTSIINGMILMFTDIVRIHDEVSINNVHGKVININFINVELLGDNGDVIVIPNNNVMAQSIVNYSRCVESTVIIEAEMDPHSVKNIKDLQQYISSRLPYNDIEFDAASLRVDIRSVQHNAISLAIHITLQNRTIEHEKIMRSAILAAMTEYSPT
ncbi:MAG: mechanosensitive ion channel family protein [Candidatus Kapaibacterium sp.]|jgi:small-conductance mechanosensitive channel|nr:mechanosensitive ion channel [Candidatus Kapabacteria bacterium]